MELLTLWCRSIITRLFEARDLPFTVVKDMRAESWNMDQTDDDSSSLSDESSRGSGSACYMALDIFL